MTLLHRHTHNFSWLVSLMLGCLVSACADEPAGPAPMEFNATTGFEESRAAVTHPLQSGYTLYATAIYTYPGSTPYYYLNGKSTGVALAYNAETNKYIAQNYYYPLSGEMKMIAYGYSQDVPTPPTITVEPSTLSTSNSNFTKITFNYTNSNNGRGEILYSEPVSVSCQLKPAEPTLHFHRAMTNLRFHFEPYDELSCAHIEINSIMVENVAFCGKFVYNYLTQKGVWSNVTERKNAYVENLTSKTLVWNQGLDAGNGIFILPETNRHRIIIQYTMINDHILDGGLGPGVNLDDNRRTLYYVVNDDYTKGWDLGARYNYNIKVRANYQMELINVDVESQVEGHTGNMTI